MKKKVIIGSIILIFLIGSMVGIFFMFGIFEIWQDTSKVSCSRLPKVEKVREIVAENKDVIDKITSLSATNNIWIEIDDKRCTGKADIIIYHSSREERKKIKEIIGKDFFSVPYRLHNI